MIDCTLTLFVAIPNGDISFSATGRQDTALRRSRVVAGVVVEDRYGRVIVPHHSLVVVGVVVVGRCGCVIALRHFRVVVEVVVVGRSGCMTNRVVWEVGMGSRAVAMLVEEEWCVGTESRGGLPVRRC